jgi:hypothetical protein
VLNKGGTNGSEFIIAEQLGLAGKQVVAVVRGNQMFVGDMLIATLTTDFSDSNLDVEKKVRGRKPVMFTLANGKGIMGPSAAAFSSRDPKRNRNQKNNGSSVPGVSGTTAS